MLAITTASERNNGRQSDFLMSMVIVLILCPWMDGIQKMQEQFSDMSMDGIQKMQELLPEEQSSYMSMDGAASTSCQGFLLYESSRLYEIIAGCYY